jgi:hypothetical protein
VTAIPICHWSFFPFPQFLCILWSSFCRQISKTKHFSWIAI